MDIQPDGIFFVILGGRSGAKALPSGIFTEEKITDWQKLNFCLAELVSEHRLNGMAAAISVPSTLVRMQTIHLPAGLSDADVEAEIYLHLQRDLPGMKDELHLDFTVLPQQAGFNDIFFVAIRNEYNSQYIDCVQTAGLKVKIVDVDVLALERSLKCVLPFTSTDTNFILHSLNQDKFLLASGLAMRNAPPW